MRRKYNRGKNQNKILILFFCVFAFMIVGYASFSTNFIVSGKGTIQIDNAAFKLKESVVTSGSGLYQDMYETNKYIYRGENPNNYIMFNNQLWRIISIEDDDTIKIMKDESIGKMAFDEMGARNNANNTFCQTSMLYCNVWAGVLGEYKGYYKCGTLTEDSTLNRYLNSEYLSTLTDINYIDTHSFNVAGCSKDTIIEDVINKEKRITWNGKIGLITVSEYMKASLNKKCKSVLISKEMPYPCKDDNFLFKNQSYRVITPLQGIEWEMTESYYVWYISRFGSIGDQTTCDECDVGYGQSSDELEIFPVLYLKPDISLRGSGTETNPYIIK